MPSPDLLVLARHATPLVDRSLPKKEWQLTREGAEAAVRMAELWRPLGVQRVVTSNERRAADTGFIASEVLDVMFHTGHNLHEHERPYIDDVEVFRAQLQAFFDDPAESRPVERRFTKAVDALARAYRGERIAIVTHGTVLALHLAAKYGADAWATWNRLAMPAYVVVELRSKAIVDLVDSV